MRHAARVIGAYRQLRRSQWHTPAQIRATQESRLGALLHHAYETVPYYRRHFDAAGFHPDHWRGLDDLCRIPLTTKADLQAAGSRRLSTAFTGDKLLRERTSGSTGQPFECHFDHHFRAVRDALFLRALTTAGYRPADRLMLVTGPRDQPSHNWRRWYYASAAEPAEQLWQRYQRIRPRLLYGCVTPLREMARAMTGHPRHRPAAIVTTAETLDAPTRRLLGKAFGAPVFDVYGLTEIGLIATECDEHAGYHLAEDIALVECDDTAKGRGGSLVMTNLTLRSMPLIRFVTGDVAAAMPPQQCACGRWQRRLERVDGRLVDVLRSPHGEWIPPYRITLAIEDLPGITRYQVIQHGANRYRVRLEGTGAADTDAVRARLHALLGNDAAIDIVIESDLTPPAGAKFRVVENRHRPDSRVPDYPLDESDPP